MLRIGIQKSGRLYDESIKLMHSRDLEFEATRNGSSLKYAVKNFPVEFVLLRGDDIPAYVSSGVVDAGIVGENVVCESGLAVNVSERLNFAHCRLVIALPKESAVKNVAELSGCAIATTYPRILDQYLQQKNIHINIRELHGSVELAPSIGVAEAIFDVVSSGSTLVTHGLRELVVVMKSQALLISANDLSLAKTDILSKLQLRVQAVERAKCNKYILLNARNDALAQIVELLPGLRSPTVVPLAESGWSSVHAVIAEDEFWEKIENLRAAGAQGIVVTSIEKMIP